MFKKIVGLGFSSTGKNRKDVEKYIKTLVEGGATEFFTGYNPPEWHEKYGFEVSPNGRFAEHEQITDFETLKAVVEEVHKYDIEIFINLNAWYYTDETFPLIKKMVSEFIELGIDGIICGNISILEYLKEINYSGKINISTIMAVYNKQAISFLLENYKINKVILSREVTLKEIESLVTSFPETLFEVFGEGDFCRYNNGLCFAEHKYGAKDICTVVMDDLVLKKRFRPDFKEFVLDENLTNEEKINLMDDSYLDIFEQIEEILSELSLSGILSLTSRKRQQELGEKLYKIIKLSQNRVDLFFDGMKKINSKKNQNILTYLKALKYITSSQPSPLKEKELKELENLKIELENSIKSGMKYLLEKTKKNGGEAKLRALELGSTYSRGDNLNLYTYVFFSQFKNIETVKFPTRGRSYNEKIKTITDVVESGEVNPEYLDRGISLERAHYDLTYLFGDKLWFREMLKEI